MKKKCPCLGITLGDPAGIGPEVTLKALQSLDGKRSFIPLIIGPLIFLGKKYQSLAQDLQVIPPNFQKEDLDPNQNYIYDLPLEILDPIIGQGTPQTGRESKIYIDQALELWRSKKIDALVTGPVSKEYIEKSGTPFTGHTEYLATALGGEPYMMMFSEKYRVLLVTTHLPLEKVPSYLNKDKILATIKMGHQSLRQIDGGAVKLALAGLDPHCGDNGVIGSFDKEVTAQAIKEARNLGVEIDGPLAADSLFLENTWSKYNLVIAHYHDQGLIPFKLLAFNKGVNVTLGLSLVRTSVDHGPAYDIAGQDKADFGSMVEALVLASELAS